MLSKFFSVIGILFAALAAYYGASFLLDDHYYAAATAQATYNKGSDEEEVLGIFNYVTGEINEFRLRSEGGLLQTPARESLERGWGECGDYVRAAIVLLHFADYKAHRVYLKSAQFSHNVLEVFFDDAWRILDPSIASYYRNQEGKIATLAELNRSPELVRKVEEEKIARGMEPVRLRSSLPAFYREHSYVKWEKNFLTRAAQRVFRLLGVDTQGIFLPYMVERPKLILFLSYLSISAVALLFAFLAGRRQKASGGSGAPENWKWLVQLRELELQMLLAGSGGGAFRRVLEIGSGRGAATGGLSRLFPSVVAMDLSEAALGEAKKARKVSGGQVHFVSADVQRLPFKPGSFDLIYASHILEHIEDRKKALREMDFVLSDDGRVFVALPTRFWKFLHLILYYPGGAKLYFASRRNIKAGRKPWEGLIVSERLRETVAGSYMVREIPHLLKPSVHGRFKNHQTEFSAYKKKEWERLFREEGFSIVNSLALYFYSPYGFLAGHFLRLRRLAVKMGLVSSRGFVLKKS